MWSGLFDSFSSFGGSNTSIVRHPGSETSSQCSTSTIYEEENNVITPAHVRQVQLELGIVQTCWPDIDVHHFENRKIFPESYYRNSEKEKVALLQAENFRQQLKNVYPENKTMVIAVENGLGLQKLVCNTIRPTALPYLKLKEWKGCAQFVADFITYIPLEKPTLPPEKHLGPYTTVSRQRGSSYEMATVLCSLLLGVDYDAYVVSGFASEDIATNVRYRTKCPIKTELPEEEIHEEELMENKYQLREIRDLRSQFLLYMVQREIDRAEAKKQAEIKAQEQEQAEREKAPDDELYDWRYHGWVLLLPKKEKQITEPFFIEPSTGEWYPTNTTVYTSIQSVWNHKNYWANLQDCSKGLGELKFDLKDISCWEHLLVGEPEEHRAGQLDPEADIDDKTGADEKHLDCPESWSEPIVVPHEKFTMHYPKGQKTTKYNRCILQQFGEYVQMDGLKHKLYHYSDFECTDLIRVEDTYIFRLDHLTAIITDLKKNTTKEYFTRGREDACKFHTFNFDKDNNVESVRSLEFYHDFRLDGLSKLEMNPLFLKETFKNREDNLCYRHAVFAERGKPPPGMIEGTRRIVISIKEKFNRDDSKSAHDDIAVRVFNLLENSIHLKYHYAKGHVTASTRDFIKPKVADRNDELMFEPSLTAGYQAEIGAKVPKQLDLYYLMTQQMKDEQKALYHLREIEDEVAAFIRSRAIESAVPQLDVSLFNQEQNEDYRQGLKDKEEQQRMYQEREVDEDIDYIAPYLVRIDAVNIELDRQQAAQVKEDCLREFRQLLTARANTLRRKFEEEYQFYLQKQRWLSSNLSLLNIEEEEEVLASLSSKKNLLHMYEIRLRRHLELSGSRYKALETYLDMHERLRILRKEKREGDIFDLDPI